MMFLVAGKYGFIDRSGQEIIPPQFYWAGSFAEGLAPVALKSQLSQEPQWGYIDTTGSIKIDVKYDDAYPFSDGLAAVVKGGMYGFIDTSGREVIPLRYLAYPKAPRATPFKDGLALVQQTWMGDYNGYIDKSGTEYWGH